MRPRVRQLALIASLLATGSVSVDATIYDGEDLAPRQILMEQRAERIAVRQIGDVVEASLPWVDQPGIRVKYDLGSTTPMERLLDRRKQEALIDNTSFGEGGVKFDIILNEKPSTNEFCYTVEGAENYVFAYQPALTLQEIARGDERPANIVGSYAVYHKSLMNNQYKTGKAFHIERPQVWSLSNESVKQYATLSYNNGRLCVTAPQSFLDTAEYPVRIDPTLGYTSAGGTNSGITTQIRVYPIQMLEAATDIESISFYYAASAGIGTSTHSLWNASTTAFSPGTLATSSQTTFDSTFSWKTLTLDGTNAVATGTYFIGISGTTTGTQLNTRTDTYGFAMYNTRAANPYTHPPQSPWTLSSVADGQSRTSAYITYTTDYSCDETTTLCGEKLILSTSRNTDHGFPGAKMAVRSSSAAYVMYEFPETTAGVGGVAMSYTTDGFGTINSNTSNVDGTNLTDTVAYALWDSTWTISSTTNYLHVTTLDTSVDDTYYTRYNLSTNAKNPAVLGTTQGGTATVGANYTAITMAENGDLFMASADTSDSWVVACNATSSCTTASNWYEKGPAGTAGAFRDLGDDVPLLSPIGGTNNIMLIYWDVSLDQLTYNVWSATSSSWFSATTTIATAIDDNTTYEGQMISMAYASTTGTTYLAVVDDANDYTTADHDIRVWKYASTSGWTALTNATTTASGGLQGVNISIDPCTGQLFVAYVRRTTIGTATTANIYWATSTDNGTTWSTEKGPITTAENYTNFGGSPVSCNQQYVTYKRVSTDSIYVNAFYNPYTAPAGGTTIYQSEFFLQ